MNCPSFYLLPKKSSFWLVGFGEMRQISCDKSEILRSSDVLDESKSRPTDTSQIAVMDPECRLIGLHLYDGLLTVLPRHCRKIFSTRFELHVLDMKFLCGCQDPTIVVLYQDKSGTRHLITYEMTLQDQNMEQNRDEDEDKWVISHPWALKNLDNTASLLIPVPSPLNGVMIIGEGTIVYCNDGVVKTNTAITHSIERVYGRADTAGYAYFLGDHKGELHLLNIKRVNETETFLDIKHLGLTSNASTISFIGNSRVYIGSRCGDSQIVEISGTSQVKVIRSLVNLGPILDFCIVDRQGQAQIVSCSGASKDGSLRILKNGIGILEQASVEMSRIKRMWSLRSNMNETYNSLLVVSFIEGGSIVLAMNRNNDLVESEIIEGFNCQVETLFCHEVLYNQLVQVTSNCVTLVSSITGELKADWNVQGDSSISVATASAAEVLLATWDVLHAKSHLILLEIGDGVLTQRGHALLKCGISCLDLNLVGEDPHIAAVGTWEWNVIIYSLPDLKEVLVEKLGEKKNVGGEDILRPCSVLLCSFEEISYLLCALQNGHIFQSVLERTPNSLRLIDQINVPVPLATHPLRLCLFSSYGCERVFVSSNNPIVIYSCNKELCYSFVNLEEVDYMCPFNFGTYPNSIAVSRKGSLGIYTIEETTKHHIETIPLEGHARCISRQEQTQTFALCIEKYTNGEPGQTGVQLVEDGTFGLKSFYNLGKDEYGVSILSCAFVGDPETYFCVGTAFLRQGENEPTRGRILVLKVSSDGQLEQIAERNTLGAVYSLNAFNGKLLAAVKKNIQLYEWLPVNRELKLRCRHSTHVQAVCVQTRGDLIVVGDVMKSISVFTLKQQDQNVIEEIAGDNTVNGMTAVEILDDGIYIGSKNSMNLFTLKLNREGSSEERKRLSVVGEYHLGDCVNRFRHGSLAMVGANKVPTVIFGTVSGGIGVIASIPREQYLLLKELQGKLRALREDANELRSGGAGMLVLLILESY